MADENVSLVVGDWMRAHPMVVSPRDSIESARALCEEHRINQLPVLSNGALVGIVTDRDLRDAFPSVSEQARHPARSHAETATTRVEEVMSRRVLTLNADDTVAKAAALMQEERIGALPVLRDGRLAGIITRSDLLRALVAMAERLAER